MRRANFHVARCAAGSINEHRPYWSLVRIPRGEALESVAANQFVARLPGEGGLRIGIDGTGRQERLFHISPAVSAGMRVRTLFRNSCGPSQARIQMGKRGMGISAGIAGDDCDRLLFAVAIKIDKAGIRFRKTLPVSAGEGESAKTDKEK